MEEDKLSDIVPSNIVSRQVRHRTRHSVDNPLKLPI